MPDASYLASTTSKQYLPLTVQMWHSVYSLLVCGAVILTHTESTVVEHNLSGDLRNLLNDNVGLILNLIGGDSDFRGVLNGNSNILENIDNSLGSLLDGEDDAVRGLLSNGNGLLGGLLKDVSDLLADLLEGKTDHLGATMSSVGGLVGGVLQKVARLAQNLVNALQGVDLSDLNALRVVFSPMPINQICPACHLLNNTDNTKACKNYCSSTCHWLF